MYAEQEDRAESVLGVRLHFPEATDSKALCLESWIWGSELCPTALMLLALDNSKSTGIAKPQNKILVFNTAQELYACWNASDLL